MVVRDQVKTMASRTHSTLESHPEVNQRRDTQALPASGKHKACKPHPLQLTRLLQYYIKKFFLYDAHKALHLLEYTMAVNHSLLEEDGIF